MTKLWQKIITTIFGIGIIGAIGVDVAIQTQQEVTDIIAVRQERCLQNTGSYCQFKKGVVNKDLFGTTIKTQPYEIIVDVWEGGKGELRNQKGYTIRYIEPYDASATTT